MATSKSQPKKIGQYTVLAKLGEGAASILYAVQNPKDKQVSALKHVEKTDDKTQRFLDQVEQEYAIGSKLDHATIRKIRKLIKHRKMLKVTAVSMIMELVDATTLDQKLPKNHGQAVEIFLQVAQGLSHMHGRGFVHADIKPNNVLVDDSGCVKIIDLGQACAIGTIKKRIQGTPGYMAPEQAHRGEITPKTDIYNLGAMMYWVLVGEVIPTAMPPKQSNNSLVGGAVDADKVELPTPPHERNSRIHTLLSKQIMDCVQPNPANRPETMQVVVNRLELILDVLNEPVDASAGTRF
ncbi:MAG: serine/threonine protein kinase [Phycisphaerae bacterium]|jgi:eukaryotic-like serine/threonine-protein kinase|nr:serine/threonine protein kinase [Phycisphaerae bacterium]